jgi:Arv1-like family
MPICIECSCPVSHLYTSYSKADDHSLGRGVRLTQCPRCQRFADKYVEHDYVVLFIDLVLIKPQVRLLVLIKDFYIWIGDDNTRRFTVIYFSIAWAETTRDSMFVPEHSILVPINHTADAFCSARLSASVFSCFCSTSI